MTRVCPFWIPALILVCTATVCAGTAGYTGIAGSPINLSNARCLVCPEYTHEAGKGETITWLHVYCRVASDSATVGLAVYSIVDGTPDERLGAVATLPISHTEARWDSVEVELEMDSGVVYGIAVGNRSGAGVSLYYGAGSCDCRSYHTNVLLPQNWTEFSRSAAYYSMYFTYESAEPPATGRERRRRVAGAGLSVEGR